jgi:hypothetical protein
MIGASTPSAQDVETYVKKHQVDILREYLGLVAIPDVRTDLPNIRKNAEYLRGMLETSQSPSPDLGDRADARRLRREAGCRRHPHHPFVDGDGENSRCHERASGEQQCTSDKRCRIERVNPEEQNSQELRGCRRQTQTNHPADHVTPGAPAGDRLRDPPVI